MKQTILKLLLIPLLAVMPAVVFMEPAYAACGQSEAAKQVGEGIDQTTTTAPSCDDSGIKRVVSLIVSILSWIAGVAAVVAIIWAGFKYVTSGGDSGKVANAKNTLIYAVVGIVVAVLAQLIVRFVISQTNNVASCPAGQHLAADGKTCVNN